MTRIELEELLSACMDGELSPQAMKKVETLLKTDAQAKSILDGYLSVRAAIQQDAVSLRYKVPTGFTANVLAAIEAKAPQSKVAGSVRYETISRWSNPRVLAWPLAVLACALFIGLFYRPDTPDTVPHIAQNTRQPTPDETMIPPPLSTGGGMVGRPKISQGAQDLKFLCRAKNAASVAKLFAQVFANYKVDWTNSTSGPANTVVYEISVTPETLHAILEEFRASPVEITGETTGIDTKNPVRVFFQVEFH